jgi:hypothetical protein
MNPPRSTTAPHPAPNHLYVIRCWPDATPTSPTEAVGWRFTLVHIPTGERRGFTDFDALMSFLRTQLDAVNSAEPGKEQP